MSRCPTCPWEFDPIPGSGDDPSPFLMLGERPGNRENERGQVFVGPTGEELDHTYLPLAGLRRYQVRCQITKK